MTATNSYEFRKILYTIEQIKSSFKFCQRHWLIIDMTFKMIVFGVEIVEIHCQFLDEI